jgi:FHA domain
VDQAYLEFSRDGRPEAVALDSRALTVGRGAGNDLCFPADSTVSERHAALERQDGGWVVRDLGSSNGTYVNGTRLAGPRRLGPGDTVALGRTRLVFRVAGAAPARPADAPGEYLDLTEEWGPAGVAAAGPAPSRPPSPAGRPPAGYPPAARPGGSAFAGPGASALDRGRESGHAEVRGTAHGVQRRNNKNGYIVLGLRVEQYDAAGHRLPPVGVEFVGYRSGQVGDGEEVAASGRWKHGTLQATKMINLTTGAHVQGRSKAEKGAVWAFGCVFCLVCLIILTAFLASL